MRVVMCYSAEKLKSSLVKKHPFVDDDKDSLQGSFSSNNIMPYFAMPLASKSTVYVQGPLIRLVTS